MGLIERVLKPKQGTVPAKEAKKKGRKKWVEIDRYIVDRLIPSDHALDAALQFCQTGDSETTVYRPIRASCSCCWHRRWALAPSSK